MIRHLFAALLAALTLNAFAAVDANQASRADLETVRGIGPSLSGKIVEARKAGEFKNWGDLVGLAVENEAGERTVTDTAATGSTKFYRVEIVKP